MQLHLCLALLILLVLVSITEPVSPARFKVTSSFMYVDDKVMARPVGAEKRKVTPFERVGIER